MPGQDQVAGGSDSKKETILGINRNVFFLGITSLFNDISSEMIYPIIPIFLTSVLGAPVSVVGLVEGIAESTASLLKVFSGWLSDRLHSRKGLAVFGYGLSTVAKPLLVFAYVWPQVLVYRIADRIGKGIRTSPRDALIADSSSKKDYGRSFGFHRTLDTIGAAIGPLLAIILLPLLHYNYQMFFAISIIPAAIAVIVLILLVREKRDGILFKIRTMDLRSFGWDFRLFLIVVLVFTIGNSSDAFLVLRAKNLGMSVVMIPVAYLIFNIVNAIIATPAGIVSDRIGRKNIMIFGFGTFALVYLGFAIVENVSFVWLLFALYGIYYAFTESIFRAYTADIVDADVRGTAYGLLNMTMGIALLPASLMAGFLWDKIGPSAPFYYGAITAGLAMILTMAILRKKP